MTIQVPFFSFVDLTSLALGYLKTAVSAYRACTTLAFYNACIIGRRLSQINEWWRHCGRAEGSFPRWIQNNMVGDALGQLSAKEIYSFVSLGKIQKQFPKVIFITLISWKKLANNPTDFYNFVTRDPARCRFWTGANFVIKMKSTASCQAINGPQCVQAECEKPMLIEPEANFKRILEYNEIETEKLGRGEIAFNIPIDDEVDMIEDVPSDD